MEFNGDRTGKGIGGNELVLDVDPLDGSILYHSYDPSVPGGSIIRREYDLQPLIERNKRLQNATDASSPGTFMDGRSFYHVASISPYHMQELVDKQILTWGGKILDDAAFTKWLNDPVRQYAVKTTLKKI